MRKSNNRDNEYNCLKFVIDALKTNNKIIEYHNCDLKIISEIFELAKQNPNKNDFPDFVFDGGGIEHFEITSSVENKKGSMFKIDKSVNERKKSEFIQNVKNQLYNSTPNPGTITSDSFKEIYENFSYENFINSLIKNIDKHNTSLIKQNYENKIVIYLIEQQTARLFIKDNKNSGEFYQLHNDKKALTLIKDKLINVNYLVYVNLDEIEILDISKIDSLIENAKEYKNIIGGRLIEISLINSIDL